MIFVDTSAWYALFVPTDGSAKRAQAWYERNTNGLVTTDYVIDELLTLLRSRGAPRTAVRVGEQLWSSGYAKVEYVTPIDLDKAWQVFRQYDDKLWSFTDCSSRVVMQRLGITEAFAFDLHFQQFGTVTVVP